MQAVSSAADGASYHAPEAQTLDDIFLDLAGSISILTEYFLRNQQAIPESRSPLPRRGATAVEFAVVVPVMLLSVFAALEFSRANILRIP